MTLPSTLRQFWAGVCAIPRFASMERLEEMREAYHRATQIRSELGIDEAGLIQQLAAEREAHEETTARLDRLIVEANQLRVDGYSLQSQLTSARADLDALTRWNNEPCELAGGLIILCATPMDLDDIKSESAAWFRAIATPGKYLWRHTPESLAAWKAREGVGGGK